MYLNKEEAVHQAKIEMAKSILNGTKVVLEYDAVDRILDELYATSHEKSNLEIEIEVLQDKIKQLEGK